MRLCSIMLSTLCVVYGAEPSPSHSVSSTTRIVTTSIAPITKEETGNTTPSTTTRLPVDHIPYSADQILTPHPFHFILNNPNICKNAPGPVHTLVAIHSSPSHYASKFKPNERRIIITIFVMGKSLNREVQDRLAFEHSEFGDIIQEDFIDSYKNLTYKNQLWMRFAKEFCPEAKFVLKSDDDIHINTLALLDHMDSLEHQAMEANETDGLGKKLWCCRWTGMPVLRDTKSKWHVPSSMYRSAYFPTYCSGSAYFLTTKAAIAMFEASQRLPFFWVDDVWATGLVPPKANVSLQETNALYIFGGGREWDQRIYLFNDKANHNFHIFGHFPEKPDHIYSLWRSNVFNAGLKSAELLPPWFLYSPNTYFPAQRYIF